MQICNEQCWWHKMPYLEMEHPSMGMIGDFGDGVGVRHLRVEGYNRARTTRPFLVSRDG